MRGVRVLELAGSVSGAYCGRLLAGIGAEVVLAEPPGGAPIRRLGPWLTDRGGQRRSASHEYLDAGKSSVVLSEAELDRGFAWADVVVSSSDGEPDAIADRHARIIATNRRAVHVVLSGFGLTGPYAGWRSTPIVDWASGGYLFLTGDPGREPLQGAGPWAAYIAGATATIGAQVALINAVRTGRGELVDIAAMEALAAAHQWSLTMYTHTGAIKRRWGLRIGEAHYPMTLFRCGDGRWVVAGAPNRDQWERFCITTDSVLMLADDALYAPAERFERADEIDATVAPWFAARTAEEAVAALQENRVPANVLLDVTQMMASEQVAVRGMLQDRTDLGENVRTIALPFRLSDSAPLDPPSPQGADTAAFLERLASGAGAAREMPVIDLNGVRVLEFSLAWAGPLAGRILGDLGLDVLKVEHPASRGLREAEPPARADGWVWGQLAPAAVRADIFPDADPGERPWNRQGMWNKMNRSKRAVALDAKTEDGAAILKRLIGEADIVLQNFSPRGARSLGIASDQVKAVNERAISIALTGFGETGPMRDYMAFGPILEAFSGFDEAMGYIGGGPSRVGVAFPDPVGALHGVVATLASLWQRERSGTAAHVDFSQFEALLSIAGEMLLAASAEGRPPERRGNRSIDHAPQGVYPCAGHDTWIALTVQSDHEWRRLVALLAEDAPAGLQSAEVASRRAAHDEIDAAISRWTGSRTPLDAARELQAAGIAAAPAFTNADIVENEQIVARGFMAEVNQPDVGPRRFPGLPIHFSRSSVHLGPAPMLGQHNREVLMALGYSREEIARLEAIEVIATEPPLA
ncbi:MAG: CoA transferase [Solirubrobacterales bacterium]|nr:CoA transferase [Solirubrobacterales bacterium]